MKTVDFTEKKAEKNGEVTVKGLVADLQSGINDGLVESIIYIVRTPDGEIVYGCNSTNQLQLLGLLECGKQLVLQDMYE